MSRARFHRGNRPILIVVLRDFNDATWIVSDDGGDFEDEDGNSERRYASDRAAYVEADRRFDHYLAENPDARIMTEVRERRGRVTRTRVHSYTRATVDR